MMMKKLLQLIRFLFIKQDVMEVYYIQGNDVLPKPLDKEEELAAPVSYTHLTLPTILLV